MISHQKLVWERTRHLLRMRSARRPSAAGQLAAALWSTLDRLVTGHLAKARVPTAA
jgi:hypothetical protein